MTASQLMTGSSAVGSQQQAAHLQRSPRRGELSAAQQGAAQASCCEPAAASGPGERKSAVGPPLTKNKRIISRMLSISAIHTSSGIGGAAPQAAVGATEPADSDAAQLAAQQGSTSVQQPEPALFQLVGCASTGASPAPEQPDKIGDRIDSSFTRSRSSSSSSTAQPGTSAGHPGADYAAQASGSAGWSAGAGERIQCLCFMAEPSAGQSSGHKSLSSIDNDKQQLLGLWLGTSGGLVLLVSLLMPDTEDNRVLQLQSVIAEPIPQAATKLRGACLAIGTFTSEPAARPAAPAAGCLASSGSAGSSQEAEPAGSGSLASRQGGSSSASSSSVDQARTPTFLALVSEKEARVYQMPGALRAGSPSVPSQTAGAAGPPSSPASDAASGGSPADTPLARLLTAKNNCLARADLSDSSFACQAAVIQMRQPEESCLVSYLASGEIKVLALPNLRPLFEGDLCPYTSARIAQTMVFSRNGHALYQSSGTELCKFSLSAHYKSLANEMTGALWVPKEMPEMPRTNFFKSLFAATSRLSDRDELFSGSTSGKASRAVAKHISSHASGLDKIKSSAAGTVGHELRQAREGLDERAEKLGDLEDRTQQMMNQAEGYAHAAHQLAQKFKDKKWYQF